MAWNPLSRRRKRRGVSQVVSTVILFSTLLVIIGVAIFYATSLIDANRQQMEYQAAKDLMLYAATALEQVSFGTGGSRYIRFSLTSTGLNFIPDAYGPLTVTVNGTTVISDAETSSIEAVGGPLVTTMFKCLRPPVEEPTAARNEVYKLVVGAGEPMVVVYENFTQGRAVVVMKPTRVRVNYLGTFEILEGGVTKTYNFYAISYINMSFAQVGGAGQIAVVFRNVNVTTSEIKIPSPGIGVTVSLGPSSQTLSLVGNPAADGSVVIVRVADIVVSTG